MLGTTLWHHPVEYPCYPVEYPYYPVEPYPWPPLVACSYDICSGPYAGTWCADQWVSRSWCRTHSGPTLETGTAPVGHFNCRKVVVTQIAGFTGRLDPFGTNHRCPRYGCRPCGQENGFYANQTCKNASFFHHLSVVDPRNLATHVSTWAEVSGPLHMPPDLRDEWEAYAKMDPLKAKGVQDVSAFWHAQDTPLALHIQQLLDVPIASDAVERTFSKAGVLDTKQRNQSRPLLRKASMMLYCNGDLEGRFSHR